MSFMRTYTNYPIFIKFGIDDLKDKGEKIGYPLKKKIQFSEFPSYNTTGARTQYTFCIRTGYIRQSCMKWRAKPGISASI